MSKEGLQAVVINMINDINDNGELTHPEGEITTPIVRELVSYKGKFNDTIDNLINQFTDIQLFAKNGGIPVLKKILSELK
ncbi:hypothetical protein [Virgibacillus salexigens]|uniref:Uncharacterized protein n=1 Tax=Virgibacillus kapii TaxID=1638645 RepID=A0ABQ2DHJ2_9BACI|nr:hypothetical protein [Virgibacillus kapii]GGJ57341.1 hypothetical protein GCM10007111_19400 [Virgibacillus kapii]